MVKEYASHTGLPLLLYYVVGPNVFVNALFLLYCIFIMSINYVFPLCIKYVAES